MREVKDVNSYSTKCYPFLLCCAGNENPPALGNLIGGYFIQIQGRNVEYMVNLLMQSSDLPC